MRILTNKIIIGSKSLIIIYIIEELNIESSILEEEEYIEYK